MNAKAFHHEAHEEFFLAERLSTSVFTQVFFVSFVSFVVKNF